MHRTAVSCLTCVTAVFATGLTSALGANISSAELKALGLEVRWGSQAVMNVHRDEVRYITNDEANVYVQSTGGMLTVFHAENGRKLWNTQVGRHDEPGMMAVTNDRTVVLVIGPVAYGFNKFNGSPLFEYRLTGQPSAAPAVNERAFYLPVSGGTLYAYSMGVLEYQFRYGKLPDDVITPFMWRFVCSEEITHPPVVGERAVSFATESNSLFSVETRGTAEGKTRVQMMLNEPATADLAVADNNSGSSILMLTGENRIFSVEMMTGKTEWTYPMGRSMSQAPIVIGNHVYVVTDDGTLTQIERDEFSPSWGRPTESADWQAPVYIGAGMTDADPDAEAQGALVKNIVEGSPAHVAGLWPGDLIVLVDGRDVDSVESARNALAELPPRVERSIVVVRAGADKRLTIRIPAIKWEARGVESLTGIGRFGVYGIDQAARLVGFDRRTGKPLGRVNIPAYAIHHHNAATDQIYLTSQSGEVVCLREIGPTVRMPELSSLSHQATVTSVKVRMGTSIESAGTVICEVRLPDGDIQEVSSDHPGTVREIYVRSGQVVNVGDSLILISDDKFATYHQKPQQRPIDVNLQDPDTAEPTDSNP